MRGCFKTALKCRLTASVCRKMHTPIIRVHLRFLPGKVQPAFLSGTTRWKSARLRGEVFQLLSAPLQGGVGFLQHPLPATPTALLAESPASKRRDVGFTMFRSNSISDDLAPASTPTVLFSVCLHGVSKQLDCTPFWLKPVSAFGFFPLTMRAAVHVSWACHPV